MQGNKEKYQRYKDRGSDGHRGSISMHICVSMPSVLRCCIKVFPSMPKGEIVERLVVIDVNP
jgi:hypothetical protein